MSELKQFSGFDFSTLEDTKEKKRRVQTYNQKNKGGQN